MVRRALVRRGSSQAVVFFHADTTSHKRSVSKTNLELHGMMIVLALSAHVGGQGGAAESAARSAGGRDCKRVGARPRASLRATRAAARSSGAARRDKLLRGDILTLLRQRALTTEKSEM
jgi:hypothetical protein